MGYTNIFQGFLDTCEKNKGKIAFLYRFGKSKLEVTYQKLFEDVLILSKAFKSKGIVKGSKVLLLSDNRYEWIVSDFALISLGAISVPRGSDTPTKELKFIIEHSEADFAILENEKLYKEHEEIFKEIKLKNIFVIEGENLHKFLNNIYSYNEILKDREYTSDDLNDFLSRRDITGLEDPFTLIYTSGTTGVPKGVVLTNKNFLANLNVIPDLVGLREDDSFVSILPSWHIFERVVEHVAVAKGCATLYSSVKNFATDLEEFKPTVVATVPRVWESLYAKINTALAKQSASKHKIFNLLVKIAAKYNRNMRVLTNKLPRFKKDFFIVSFFKKFIAFVKLVFLYLPNKLARKKFRAVQEKFGGRLRLAVSGGGSLPAYLDEWIDALGIRIVNAYGMTECAPGIAGRGLDCDIFGTLGKPLKNTQVKIVDDEGNELPPGVQGEILIKGPQVMPGYYKNEEENKKCFTEDGFFKTGDLGMLTITGELVITGRSKEIIVLSSGENIDPSRIESEISQLPFVKDAVLVGQDKKGLAALVVPDFDALKEYMEKKYNKISDTFKNLNDRELVDKIKQEFNKLLHAKKGFKPYEKIHNIFFLDKEFTLGEELTNTLKKKRHYIEKKYREIIDKLFH
ncbi:long-chain fatty acid--CoA ligase [Deferribacterales bacterium Es71-Z0220]|uniref:AMP-dependent synthetase/ligase n=1 Tax=Deferrivibrio essentukiensis TaxID=2880922 RepID=UPI001F61ABFD|nr:long-chain fatty acid--CoA ligase [Deferrivibrio essentukiensis]MCB4205024.1 long-chain fatty acid--CoA ligase [Deferrivibrio essentukiensis]